MIIFNEKDTENLNYPLIVSSSLDCSIRIWDICKGACVKEIYLYNPVNHFQINETMFLVGLEAGKLQYLDNLTQIATMKAFDDVDSVCCVQVIKIYFF
jgi:WD40 repeat protein